MLKNIGLAFMLILVLVLPACSPQFAGGQSGGSQDEIGAAALAGLEAIGWDIAGFEATTEMVDGAYARVSVASSNPPGGFTAFMQLVDGQWALLTQGSAFNPADLQAMGIPNSVLGPWSSDTAPAPAGDDLGAATLAGLAAIGWDIDGFEAEVQAVEGDYAKVLVHSSNPPGGFTAYMQQVDGQWTLLTQGSAFNPADLEAMDIPDSLINN
jgi:hypothetical protein